MTRVAGDYNCFKKLFTKGLANQMAAAMPADGSAEREKSVRSAAGAAAERERFDMEKRPRESGNGPSQEALSLDPAGSKPVRPPSRSPLGHRT